MAARRNQSKAKSDPPASKSDDRTETSENKNPSEPADELFIGDTETATASVTTETQMPKTELNDDGMESGTPAETVAVNSEPTPDHPPAAPAEVVKQAPMRVDVEKPVCPTHFCKMVVSSTQESEDGTTRYYKCKAEHCNHRDATFENGLALDSPVPCPKQVCRERNISMEINLERSRSEGGVRLHFTCPICGHQDTRAGRAMETMAKRQSDLINRPRQ